MAINSNSVTSRSSTVLLFDLDGTLTEPRQIISPQLYNYLVKEAKRQVRIGIVGGSDLPKIVEQLGHGEQAIQEFDYVFAENGMVAYANGALRATQSIQKALGEEKLQDFTNYVLAYLSRLKLPKKRGNFVELRKGMINVCPVGRSCSQEERIEFYEYDQKEKIRETMAADLRRQFDSMGLQFSIGGQISLDVFPKGWDKTYCLRFFDEEQEASSTVIHFFGDKTNPGENDYEIFTHPRTIGHSVRGPQSTEDLVRALLRS